VISGRETRVPLDWNDTPALREQANPFLKPVEAPTAIVTEPEWDDPPVLGEKAVQYSGSVEPASLRDRVLDTFDAWQPGMLVLLIPIAFVAVALVYLTQSDTGDQNIFGEDLEAGLPTARSGDLTLPTIELEGPTADQVPDFPAAEQPTPNAGDLVDDTNGVSIVGAPGNGPSAQGRIPSQADTSTTGVSTTSTSAPSTTIQTRATPTTKNPTTSAPATTTTVEPTTTTVEPTTTTTEPPRTTVKPTPTKPKATSQAPTTASLCRLLINRSVELTSKPRRTAKKVGEAKAGVYRAASISDKPSTRWYQITSGDITGWLEAGSATSFLGDC